MGTKLVLQRNEIRDLTHVVTTGRFGEVLTVALMFESRGEKFSFTLQEPAIIPPEASIEEALKALDAKAISSLSIFRDESDSSSVKQWRVEIWAGSPCLIIRCGGIDGLANDGRRC